VTGGDGEHLIEQFWHAGVPVRRLDANSFAIGSSAVLSIATPDAAQLEISEGGEHGWRSHAFGNKSPAPLIRVSHNTTLPVRFAAMLDLAACNRAGRISILQTADQAVELLFESRQTGRIWFSRGSQPKCRLSVPGGK
jgi:hypothetical protein